MIELHCLIQKNPETFTVARARNKGKNAEIAHQLPWPNWRILDIAFSVQQRQFWKYIANSVRAMKRNTSCIPSLKVNDHNVDYLTDAKDKATALSNILAPPMTLTFRASLLIRHPFIYQKIENIVPLFKKHNQSIPGNYRPVFLVHVSVPNYNSNT